MTRSQRLRPAAISTIYGQSNQYRVCLDRLAIPRRPGSTSSSTFRALSGAPPVPVLVPRHPLGPHKFRLLRCTVRTRHRAPPDRAPGAVPRPSRSLQSRRRSGAGNAVSASRTTEQPIGMPDLVIGSIPAIGGEFAKCSKASHGLTWRLQRDLHRSRSARGDFIHPLTIRHLHRRHPGVLGPPALIVVFATTFPVQRRSWSSVRY